MRHFKGCGAPFSRPRSSVLAPAELCPLARRCSGRHMTSHIIHLKQQRFTGSSGPNPPNSPRRARTLHAAKTGREPPRGAPLTGTWTHPDADGPGLSPGFLFYRPGRGRVHGPPTSPSTNFCRNPATYRCMRRPSRTQPL